MIAKTCSYPDKTTLPVIFMAAVCLLAGCAKTDHKTTNRVLANSTPVEGWAIWPEPSYFGPLVDTILNHSNIKFFKIEKDNLAFYYEPGPFFEKNINHLIADAIRAKNHCIRLLGNKPIPYPLKIIYFNDREKLRPYLNMAPKGYALPDAYTLLIATNDSTRAYHTHELMHIVSINQFGGYAAEPTAWIQEGIAVYADNPCMTYPIHAIAANLLHTNKLASLDSLFHQFRQLPEIAAYLQAGSTVQFFVEQYGLVKFEALWRHGVEHMEKIILKSKLDFEKEYHQFLKKTYPKPPAIDWVLLNKKGCG
ncbi:MAG: hypothetical protein HUU01_17030 [Saprospiraceae bacterium]|nr:hypothetical protein [Saprospiraceae bacterium]